MKESRVGQFFVGDHSFGIDYPAFGINAKNVLKSGYVDAGVLTRALAKQIGGFLFKPDVPTCPILDHPDEARPALLIGSRVQAPKTLRFDHLFLGRSRRHSRRRSS